jgi:hypothetical protein
MGAFVRAFRSRQAASLTSLVLSSLSPQVYAAGPPPRSPELLELFREADQAIARLDVGRTRELWGQVYSLEPSTAALCQLGQLDRRLERWETAAAELSRCVEQMPAPKDARERGLHETRHADYVAVRRHVGELEVSPPPGAMRVLVAGKEVDAGRKVYVAPGEHEVTATGPRGQVARAHVKIAAGEALKVPLAFEEKPPASAAKAPHAPAPRPPSSERASPNRWILGTGVFMAASLLGTGIGLHMAASGADGDASRRKGEIDDAGLDPSGSEYADAYEQANGVHERADQLHTWGSTALLAGAALGAATLVYIVLPRGTEVRAHAGGVKVKLAW